MAFFFVPLTEVQVGQHVTLEGAAAHRLLHVRRFKTGEKIEIQTDSGERFSAKITEAASREMSLLVTAALPLPATPATPVKLAIAQISENNLDLVIQKATELGASDILIFQAEHSPHAIKSDRLAHKMERWNAIATNACEQSGRASPPLIYYVDSLGQALLESAETTCVALEQGMPAFSAETYDKAPMTLFIGPEGGWSEDELALLKENPTVTFVSIGINTLRAETAAIAGLAIALN